MKHSQIELEVKESGGGFSILDLLKQCTAYYTLCSPTAGLLLVLLLRTTVIINLCSRTISGTSLRIVTLLNVGEANVHVT